MRSAGRIGLRLLARDRRGVTMVEFAMLLPFFVILLFGIIQFAQVLFFQAALQHAVTAASRCATLFNTADALGASSTPPDCSTGANIVILAAQQAYGLNIPTSTFTATAPAGYNCVAASYAFNFGVPFMPKFNLSLTANSCYPV